MSSTLLLIQPCPKPVPNFLINCTTFWFKVTAQRCQQCSWSTVNFQSTWGSSCPEDQQSCLRGRDGGAMRCSCCSYYSANYFEPPLLGDLLAGKLPLWWEPSAVPPTPAASKEPAFSGWSCPSINWSGSTCHQIDLAWNLTLLDGATEDQDGIGYNLTHLQFKFNLQ